MIRLGYVRTLDHSNVVKRTMASKNETTVTFSRASPVNSSCLGWCLRSWVDCPRNVDVANLESLPGSELLIITTVSASADSAAPSVIFRERPSTRWDSPHKLK